MITISAHGVLHEPCPTFPDQFLSPMQCRLLTDPAPIRICGAPTGAGKTYAFIQSIKASHHSWVLFIVPTQALAANIAEAARHEDIFTTVWDGAQYQSVAKKGQDVWTVRRQDLETADQRGGLILTTPETLGQIFLGVPYRNSIPHMSIKSLLTAHHIVFDEVHLLTERALGFVQSWMTLIAWQKQHYPDGTPYLTLLSATHSTLVSKLIGKELPASTVSCFDEDIVTIDSHVDRPHLRLLHGTVRIHVDGHSVPAILHRELPQLMQNHRQILVIFDSLKQYSTHATAIEDWVRSQGIAPHEVFVVTGQERQSGKALDEVGFEAGITPQEYHRIIIGTSSLEVGITYPHVTAAIIDVGLTPAALIQRIGRVARGGRDGEIWVATPSQHIPSHFITLQHLDGKEFTPEEFREPFAPYVPIDFRRARALGSAYWSMMGETRAPAYAALKEMHNDLSDTPLPGRQLNQLRFLAHELKPNTKNAYERWLKAIDGALKDVRGFSPTVMIRFADREPIRCERDWALRYLGDPDGIDIDGNCWIYRKTRDACLLDRPRTVQISLMRPTLREGPLLLDWVPGSQAYASILEQYLRKLRESKVYPTHPIWSKTYDFIAATGLLVRDTDGSANVIDIPAIDGSLQM